MEPVPKYNTDGREALKLLGKGPSELCAELRESTPGMNLDVSTVWRWCSGDIRPEAFWRIAMAKIWGIPESSWLLPKERVALNGRGAA